MTHIKHPNQPLFQREARNVNNATPLQKFLPLKSRSKENLLLIQTPRNCTLKKASSTSPSKNRSITSPRGIVKTPSQPYGYSYPPRPAFDQPDLAIVGSVQTNKNQIGTHQQLLYDCVVYSNLPRY
jgi:hypothetical protein